MHSKPPLLIGEGAVERGQSAELAAKLLRGGLATAVSAPAPLNLGHADASRRALQLGGSHRGGLLAQIAALQQGCGPLASLLGAFLVNVG